LRAPSHPGSTAANPRMASPTSRMPSAYRKRQTRCFADAIARALLRGFSSPMRSNVRELLPARGPNRSAGPHHSLSTTVHDSCRAKALEYRARGDCEMLDLFPPLRRADSGAAGASRATSYLLLEPRWIRYRTYRGNSDPWSPTAGLPFGYHPHDLRSHPARGSPPVSLPYPHAHILGAFNSPMLWQVALLTVTPPTNHRFKPAPPSVMAPVRPT